MSDDVVNDIDGPVANSKWAQLRFDIAVLLLLILLRAAALGTPGLSDPSESRYAGIGQRMVTSAEWLVPMIDRGEGVEAFWGKPPLHFWLVAASFKVFGFTEFAARLPSFIAGLCVLLLVGVASVRFLSLQAGLLGAAILFSSATFILLSGACMLDMTLCLACCGAMVAFALAALTPQSGRSERLWGFAFFGFAALGMLTKGPVALAFIGASLGLFFVVSGRWSVLRKMPWGWGTALFLALSVPWFVFAEQRSPGLLQYFFVQENLMRFISPNYGDLYGSAHPIFRGAIWLFVFVGMLPWSVWGLGFLGRLKLWRGWRARSEADPALLFIGYSACWAIVPLLFFTPARSVIFSYAVPSFPAMALLLAGLVEHRPDPSALSCRTVPVWLWLVAAVCAASASVLTIFAAQSPIEIVLCLVSFVLLAYLIWRGVKERTLLCQQTILVVSFFIITVLLLGILAFRKTIDGASSTRSLLRYVEAHYASPTSIVFGEKLPYSAQFYSVASPGAVSISKMGPDLSPLPQNGIVVLTKKELKRLEAQPVGGFKPVATVGRWVILDRAAPGGAAGVK